MVIFLKYIDKQSGVELSISEKYVLSIILDSGKCAEFGYVNSTSIITPQHTANAIKKLAAIGLIEYCSKASELNPTPDNNVPLLP